MEIKEAIEWIKKHHDTQMNSDDSEAMRMAISALENQIGKKPRTERVDFNKYGEYCINYYCPCCNRRMVSKDKTGWFAGNNCRYCECGQKIDWSEVADD